MRKVAVAQEERTKPYPIVQGSRQPIIEMHKLCKTYGTGDIQVEALKEVDLSIDEGEFVAIMGQSGSGKSTLMHVMGCLDNLTSGTYRLAGRDIGEMDDLELATIRNQLIGFVFQQFHLLAYLTAQKNVELPLVYAGVPPHERRRRAAEALEAMGLANRAHHRPGELSGGQQQRVAIARALVTNPALILADEPTGNLSSEQSEEVLAIFTRLNEQGKTVVLITHEPDVAHWARRIIHIRDGQIVGDEPVENRHVAGESLYATRTQALLKVPSSDVREEK
jgi:putative ABC transport system ATP-binding protein